MAVNRFYFFTLIVLVFLLGYLNYQVWKPFLSVIEIFRSMEEFNHAEATFKGHA